MEAVYLVFDGTRDESYTVYGFTGASVDFLEACTLAHQAGDAIVMQLKDMKFDEMARLSSRTHWYFADDAPYTPFKFKRGEAVKYLSGDEWKYGNIEYGLVTLHTRADQQKSPPFDADVEREYVVNNRFVREEHLTRVSDG